MEQMAYFLKRTPAVEPFKELTEQTDNNFTLLDLLDPTYVVAVCAAQNYIFTLHSGTIDVKCWSSRSAKLQNSARFQMIFNLNKSSPENFSFMLVKLGMMNSLITVCN
jgi:hypothetical protein